MKEMLKQISEIVAQANDLFQDKHQSLDIVMGIIDKGLRQQGMQADAITLDCLPLNKKIVFLLHDGKSSSIDVALGNKAGDIHTSSSYDFDKISVSVVQSLMEDSFIL